MHTFILLSLFTAAAVYCSPHLINSVLPQESNSISDMKNWCGEGSDCVRYFLCKNSSLISDGKRVIDIRSGANSQCPHYLDVCCNIKEKSIHPINDVKPTSDGCGVRKENGLGFIITGDKDNETEYGEFPWMVAIIEQEKAVNQALKVYKGGGSLIHPKVVLTAAHCVYKIPTNALKIRVGEWDTQVDTELFPHQERSVATVVVHEHFDNESLHNDIALLFLDTPVVLAENVGTICLPPANTQFDFTRCVATGWGKDMFGKEGKYQVILKKIDLPVVPRDQCQALLRTTRLGWYFELHHSFICAGGETGKDMCKGDGGSPLVCPIDGTPDQYHQAGMVAWGIGCGDAIPGVYVSIAELRPWLDEQLAYRNVESSYYTA